MSALRSFTNVAAAGGICDSNAGESAGEAGDPFRMEWRVGGDSETWLGQIGDPSNKPILVPALG